jgi:branched-chain amino acid transport system permease protein
MEGFIAQVINGLATGSIYALIVLGMNLLVLVRDIVHQGYAHIVMITMAAGWLTLNSANGNIVIAIIVMIIAGILVTMATEPLFRPLCKRGAQLETIVLAMSVGIILTEVMSQFVNNGGNFSFPASMRGGGKTVHLGLIQFSLANIIALISAIVVALLLLWFMFNTQKGRAIRAMAQNLRVARTLGIPFGQTGLFGFALAGILAAIIALLLIMTVGTCGPSIGDTFATKAIILMLFAGMGNLKGGLMSALFMGLVESMALAYLPGSWTEAIFYGIIMLVIIWKPNGLFGKSN